MYVVTVEFTPNPAKLDTFLPLMVENARASRESQPGCRQFDISIDAAKPATVLLYEIYDDRAAFDTHLASPHFKAFAAATPAMITGRAVQTWQRIAP